jgi:hypothetical protein
MRMRYIYFSLVSIFFVILVILYNFVTSRTGLVPIPSSEEYIGIILQMVNMILGLLAVVAVITSIQKFQDSNFGHILIFFTFGTFLLSLIRLFLMLCEVQILPLAEETASLGWHIIFYCAAICFLGGVQKIYIFSKEKGQSVATENPSIFGPILTAIGIVVLASAHTLDQTYVRILRYNPLYILGLHHFIAFLFAGFIVFYLWKAKKRSNQFKLIINAFLWAFIFLAVVHIWELLTESLHVISINPELGEHIEQVITLFGYLFILKAYLQKVPVEEKLTEAAKSI